MEYPATLFQAAPRRTLQMLQGGILLIETCATLHRLSGFCALTLPSIPAISSLSQTGDDDALVGATSYPSPIDNVLAQNQGPGPTLQLVTGPRQSLPSRVDQIILQHVVSGRRIRESSRR
jgi:hypothetical protein